MFLINSRLGRFSAACFGSPRVVVHLPQAPLLPKLRGHFAEFLLRGSLEHLRLLASPTCVRLRYGRPSTSHARLFSAAWLRTLCREQFPFGIGARLKESFLPPHRLPPYIGYSTTRRSCHFRVPPHGQTLLERYRNIDLFPIAYALRPRLRDRLTRSG